MAKGLEKVVGVLKTHRWRSNICCCDYVLRDRQHLFHWFSIVGQSFCCAVVVWLSHKKKYPGAFKNKKEKKKKSTNLKCTRTDGITKQLRGKFRRGCNERTKKKKNHYISEDPEEIFFLCVWYKTTSLHRTIAASVFLTPAKRERES